MYIYSQGDIHCDLQLIHQHVHLPNKFSTLAVFFWHN